MHCKGQRVSCLELCSGCKSVKTSDYRVLHDGFAGVLKESEESKDGERVVLPSGVVHQLVVQGQVVSPEYMHASNITWTELVMIRKTYVYA